MTSARVARRVLLVDPDFDALGKLAAQLRGRGFHVILADNVASALDSAKVSAPDIVLGASALCHAGGLADQLRAEPALARTPVVVLVADQPGAAPTPGHARREDLDALMGQILAAPLRSLPVEATQGEVRGDLSQVPLVDLLQVLSMNRRSGVLSVTTALGSGEVRIGDGDVLDAVYRRLEGEKALYRLLGERDGTFAFVPGGTAALRRVNIGTSMLVMEAMRQADEVVRLRAQLAPGGDALMATQAVSDGAPKLERDVLQLLQTPRSVDEVLDEVQAPDLDVLNAMLSLSQRHLLRRIARAALLTRLASDDRLQMLRALVGRLSKQGFAGAPRLGIAAPAHRLASLAVAMLRIEDVMAPYDSPPSAAVPYLMATLRFGEAVDLSVVGLPLDGRFAPLWGLTLPALGAVVRLDGTDCAEFDAACAAGESLVLHAAALIGEVDEGDPAQVAALLRVSLETAAGS